MTPCTASRVSVEILSGFDDPAVATAQWRALLSAGDTNVVFLTHAWQKAWWSCYGRGKLLLVCVRRGDQIVAVAPLFTDGGMIFFVGSGGSDYLDFIGDVSDPEVLGAILDCARQQVDDFVGFRFYLVPDQSRTGALLQRAAGCLDLDIYDEGELTAPALDLTVPGAHVAAVNKQSLRRRERYFERMGGYVEHNWQNAAEILPQLDEFFEQHIERWKNTAYPSLFLDESNKSFYREVTKQGAIAGWLRFTRIDWQKRAVAYHFGFCYRHQFLWYKPTFDINLAHCSPGELLLRRLLIAAVDEGAQVFDFGLGDEPFKSRFASRVNTVRTWALYPRETNSLSEKDMQCES